MRAERTVSREEQTW
ncbi:hypothetical protein NFI96_021646 [Prochilodus magdalenae]|nr:hypothetical protein NFI96_021646 [Prochilodus magdalenae]